MTKEVLHIYTRVSSKSQEDNTSLEQQKNAGVKLAGILGMEHKLWNEGVASSSSDEIEDRPVLTDLLRGVEDGEVKHIYVEYPDRLSRNQKTWGAIRFLIQRSQVKFYDGTSTEPRDLEDPMDELIVSIISAISIFDNKLRTRRLNTGKFRRIAEGGWLGGPPPFGYQLENKQLVIHPTESKWVVKIFEKFRDTKSIDQIRTMLMDNGVKTRRNKPVWSHGSIEKLLTNTHYSGTYKVSEAKKVFNKETQTYERKVLRSYNCESPIILNSQLWKDVKEILESRSNKNRVKQPNQKQFYLLNDFLYCGYCGRKMSGKTIHSRKQSFYYCPSKERKYSSTDANFKECVSVRQLRREQLEQIVWDAVVDTLENSNQFKDLIKKETLSAGKTFSRTKKDIRNDEKKVRQIDRDIETIKKSIATMEVSRNLSTPTGAALKKGNSDIDVDDMIAAYTEKLTELRMERRDLSDQITKGNADQKWIDWLGKFAEKIDYLRNEYDAEVRKEFLSGVLMSADVYTDSTGGTSHRIEVNFKVPIVDDGHRWFDPKQKSLGYEIIEGKSSTTVVYDSEDDKKKVVG